VARGRKRPLESESRPSATPVEWKVDLQLDHIARYLQRNYDFTADTVRCARSGPPATALRKALIDELLENPDMSNDEIRESIEDQIEDRRSTKHR